ncbi:MAG: rRNA maturation RNase YbeY [Candidatus Neomarinimicrobiota bacterium]|jgi:rRNA maturation RNase YbeY|nr:rRNA maturation RNase YbeY [Candidatus Neomarinimicrobiota bacterium]MDD3966352.1 rRNA maturation RNase YbeY [Candidatus Neomarinimicrobiota bacterium]MDX9780403.1 rRNA maturation RNase YbeY [bacterium]
MSCSIRIFNESKVKLPLPDLRIRQLLRNVLLALERRDFQIRLIATGEEALREMKVSYFNEDVYTDIISFLLEDEMTLEGELYCSPERIRNNAESYGERPEREFARVLIHGACHLCGYEDGSEAERRSMTELEDRFLTQFFDG